MANKKKRTIRQRHRRYVCQGSLDENVCKELLSGVWNLEWTNDHLNTNVPPNPYVEHWTNCVIEANDEDLLLDDREVAIGLVDVVKNDGGNECTTILRNIADMYAAFPGQPLQLTDEQAITALRFALGLWLHVFPGTNQSWSLQLQEVVNEHVPERTITQAEGHLSYDFCARHLVRKGGFNIVWTDRVDEHLTVTRGQSIRVFRHSSMLRSLQHQSNPFPPGFIEETLQTLYLLFRPLEPRKARRNIRYMEKHFEVDLELAMAKNTVFQLNQYPFWHERLQQIQDLYDKKTPSGLAQWWFDRRNRVQWATFWVAFLVLLLTIIFGLIQSITGVMQVYATFRLPEGNS